MSGDETSMRAGAAMVDITPALGTHLAGSGMGEHRPAESVLDRLYAKAAVFAIGGRRLCIVTLDVLAVTGEYTARIRQSAAERYGLDPEAVMVHALQTHSAPSCGGMMLDPDFPIELTPETEYLTGSEAPYADRVASQAVEAIGKALGHMEPVEIGTGSGVRADVAFNRRCVTRDGTIRMPGLYSSEDMPLGPTDILYLEGPTDPEVGVLCARCSHRRVKTILLHHTCHPVNLFATQRGAVSADWPGAWSRVVQQTQGPDCVPLVLNGCCGNVNPWPPFQPDFRPDHRRMGESLGDTTERVVGRMTFSDASVLDGRVRRVPLDYRSVPGERQAEVDRILADHPQPKWLADDPTRIDPEWFHAASTKSIEYCGRRSGQFMYEIQVFRIGDAAVVALPGEPFCEGQLAIKMASPFRFTTVAHMSTQYVGYVPTSEACARGGHEANEKCTYWAKLAPDSLDRIVKNTVALLHELFP